MSEKKTTKTAPKKQEAKNNEKQYIYIVQYTKEYIDCKIGKTNNLEKQLELYNKSAKNKNENYQYLFTCEVKDMAKVENDIKKHFSTMRHDNSNDTYFINNHWLKEYAKFIKEHKLFLKTIINKTKVFSKNSKEKEK